MDDFFKDLVVVELASVLAGPAVGMFFAELGARVIKIENKNTNGDITRQWKHAKESKDEAKSAYYHCVNWNKEVIFSDLKSDSDKQQIISIIKSCDIVISNFKAGSAEKLGLDYSSLKKLKSDIIYAHITGYGENDPRPGFDARIQAETGWMSINGNKDGDPTKVPVAIIDLFSAHQLKEGILCALLKKEKSGLGSKVSVSLYDSSVSSLANQSSNYLNLGINGNRNGSLHPNIAPYGEIVSSIDGANFMLAIGNDQQFEQMCRVFKVNITTNEKSFITNPSRLQNRFILLPLLKDAFKRYSAIEIETLSMEHQLPIGRIKSIAEALETKRSQSLILKQDETGYTSQRIASSVFKIS